MAQLTLVVSSQLGEVVRHSGFCEFYSCVLCRDESRQVRDEGAQYPGRRITRGRRKVATMS